MKWEQLKQHVADAHAAEVMEGCYDDSDIRRILSTHDREAWDRLPEGDDRPKAILEAYAKYARRRISGWDVQDVAGLRRRFRDAFPEELLKGPLKVELDDQGDWTVSSAPMDDRQFEVLMERVASAYGKYRRLLEQAEKEYERRYGAHPSDVGDDAWIDAMQGGCGEGMALTAAEVDEGAREFGLSRVDKAGRDGG